MKKKIIVLLAIGMLFGLPKVWAAQGGRKKIHLDSNPGLPMHCPSGEHPYSSACACYGEEELLPTFFALYPEAAVECGRNIEVKKPVKKVTKALHPTLIKLYEQACKIDPDNEDELQPVFDAIMDEFQNDDIMEIFSDVLAEDDGDLEEGLSRLANALSHIPEAHVAVKSHSHGKKAPMVVQEEVVVPHVNEQEDAIQEVVSVYKTLYGLKNDTIRFQGYMDQVFPLLKPAQQQVLESLMQARIESLEELEILVRSHFLQ